MLDKISTERRNEKSLNLDTMTIMEALTLMNNEDMQVIYAVKSQLGNIEQAIEFTTNSLRNGGRIIYMGAGTSGRLGLLDAVECPPTFGVDPSVVVGLLAGGENAFIKAVEGAEDNREQGIQDLKSINISKNDTLIGIAASGRTPYVVAGLEYAQSIGVKTVAISSSKKPEIGNHAQVSIELICGPEVLTGSTRLKSGTSQKMVLNMISTISMRGIGKVYQNLMVDLKPTNDKLIERSKLVIMEATGADYQVASAMFELSEKSVKIAIVMIQHNCRREEAIKIIEKNKGFIK